MRHTLVLLVFLGACAAERTPETTPEVTPVPEVTELVHSAYEAGRREAELNSELRTQKEKLEASLARLDAEKARLLELHSVLVFTRCLERRSKKSAKVAFEQGKFNKPCLAEIQALSPDEIHERAERILKEPT